MNTLKNRAPNKLALVALLALALPLAKVYAGSFATNYTNASLMGIFGYSSEGWSVDIHQGTNDTPLDVVGIMSFDGNGNFSFHDTVNVGGNIIQRGTADSPIVGTYTVASDGTGTMEWTSGGANHVRAFAIVDGGRELQFGEADSAGPNRGVAKKQ